MLCSNLEQTPLNRSQQLSLSVIVDGTTDKLTNNKRLLYSDNRRIKKHQ